MDAMFKHAEWNERPPAATRTRDGRFRVTRGVAAVERDSVTVWCGESAIMSETQYAAYVGAKEVAERREAEIIDDYTMSLIEGGII